MRRRQPVKASALRDNRKTAALSSRKAARAIRRSLWFNNVFMAASATTTLQTRDELPRVFLPNETEHRSITATGVSMRLLEGNLRGGKQAGESGSALR